MPEQEGLGLYQHVGHLLRRLNQQSVEAFLELSQSQGYAISPPQYAALLALQELGPCSQRRLGQYIAMETSNLHGLLKRMAKQGWLSIGKDPQHHRRSVIYLEAEGEAVLAVLTPLIEKRNLAVLSKLSDEEQEVFVALLKKLQEV
ncbi:MAG: MarR family winged helix-turn-helix transcriptional regulator [Deinococcales bacterium]